MAVFAPACRLFSPVGATHDHARAHDRVRPDELELALWCLGAVPLVAAALFLRIRVHLGRSPGGVDTWYYLAYADAFRRRPSLDVRLPHYLLQDERQSYAPLFPSLLALLPARVLRRWFWLVSPAIDCLHLLLLYWLAFKITASVSAAFVAACIYAFTPHLISETRSLNGRSFGALVNSLALVLELRFVLGGEVWPWLPLALLTGAAVFLTSATSSAAYGLVSLVLCVYLGDARYLAVACLSLLTALVLSRGHYLRVVHNYWYAFEYWKRNRANLGADPIERSPVYGRLEATPAGVSGAPQPGFFGGNRLLQVVRLVAENPFVLALPFAPYSSAPWGPLLYVWAVSLVVFSILATLLPPLRLFGPGRGYVKASVFPTAYTLAIGLGGLYGLQTPFGVAIIACLVASIATIVFFYAYMGRRTAEQTASVPAGLAEAASALASMPAGGVLCLPTMYADYVCYNAAKGVLWGGHCGDLRKFEAIAPVFSRPFPELFRQYGVRYVLLDTSFADPARLCLDEMLTPLGAWGGFHLYEVDHHVLAHAVTANPASTTATP